MKLKSYFAGTVEMAMSLARQELGPEAVLVHSRKTNGDARRLGEYEVVFALLPEDAGAASAPGGVSEEPRIVPQRTVAQRTAAVLAATTPPSSVVRKAPAPIAPPAPAAAPAPAMLPEAIAKLSQEIAGLKERIERMSSSFAHALVTPVAPMVPPEAVETLGLLLDAGVNEDLATDLATTAANHSPDRDTGLAAVLADRLAFDATVGRENRPRRIVALVGPPGAGKTTTLVKLAARYGLAARCPTQIVTADTQRIAAPEQLRAYASILGSSFRCAESVDSLERILADPRHKGITLIDTPGVALSELGSIGDLARMLATHDEVDVHLTVPASMRPADLTRIIAQYRVFGPRKLIFTRVDETSGAGGLLEEAQRCGLPLSFFATGQQVPEDLVPASARALALLLLRNPAESIADSPEPAGAAAVAGAGNERG